MKYLVGILALCCSLANAAEVDLCWVPPTQNEDGSPVDLDGYRVYMREDGEQFGAPVATIPDPAQTCATVDVGLGVISPGDNERFFVMTAYGDSGESLQSNQIRTVVTGTAPEPPAVPPTPPTDVRARLQLVLDIDCSPELASCEVTVGGDAIVSPPPPVEPPPVEPSRRNRGGINRGRNKV